MTWTPITRSEFDELYETQLGDLTSEQRESFERFHVPVDTCRIRRSVVWGDELVFVVARNANGVMYFDDVEWGFNVSMVDESDCILNPGGNQYTLSEAVQAWLMSKT